jgi:hypothetical protein
MKRKIQIVVDRIPGVAKFGRRIPFASYAFICAASAMLACGGPSSPGKADAAASDGPSKQAGSGGSATAMDGPISTSTGGTPDASGVAGTDATTAGVDAPGAGGAAGSPGLTGTGATTAGVDAPGAGGTGGTAAAVDAPGAGGAAGSPGVTGTGGTTAAVDAPGAGGVASSGGAAGSDGVGTGGTTAGADAPSAGGAAGSGVASGSGGTASSPGVAGTGGATGLGGTAGTGASSGSNASNQDAGSSEGQPSITLNTPATGATQLSGGTHNVDTTVDKVVVYALTNQWYVQPLDTAAFTNIGSDGSWSTSTHYWNAIVALLVNPATYTLEDTEVTNPALDPGVIAWAQYPSGPISVQFSGYTWGIKMTGSTPGDQFDPGPNFWSNDPSVLSVDSDGLHLKINQINGVWQCAEVFLTKSLGYGTYTVQVNSHLDQLPLNTVAAPLFIYAAPGQEFDNEYSGPDGLTTIAAPNNAQFVAQRSDGQFIPGTNLLTYPQPSTAQFTTQMVWSANQVTFTSWNGWASNPTASTQIATWTYNGAPIPQPGQERVHINLWLYGGIAPVTGTGDEMTINSFSFQSLATDAGGIDAASNTVTGSDAGTSPVFDSGTDSDTGMLSAECPEEASFTYVPIANVPTAVNNLGCLIGQEQRYVVTPGGNQYNPGFSAVDQSNFDNSNKLTSIVSQVTASQTFTLGVAAIRTLPPTTQQAVFTSYSAPIDPTWAMTGQIGDGTTTAGEAVEQEIATALTNAVEAAL